MSDTPLHDWMTPRLNALLDEAVKAGFDRQIAVDVLIDLIESVSLNPPAPIVGD
ncbi:MAG: hypothetical protein ABI224_08575 [Acetobacteraceae bacterium]